MRTTKMMIGLMMSLMTVGANATVVEYDMHWEGAGGYTVVGAFSFDDATVGTEADDTELLSFMATAFEPDGDPLKSYDLTNQAPSFNFHFDLASQSILQSGFTTSATGFLIGNFDVNDWFFGGGTTGCAQSGNVGIVLSIQGGCQSQILDELGTALLASEKTSVPDPGIPEPTTIVLLVLGLTGLAYQWRKQKKAA